MTDLLEALMILCFGLSWPISIRKSWISRTAQGKSLFFEFFIWIGYIFGIARKFMLWNAANVAGNPLDWLFYLGWIRKKPESNRAAGTYDKIWLTAKERKNTQKALHRDGWALFLRVGNERCVRAEWKTYFM